MKPTRGPYGAIDLTLPFVDVAVTLHDAAFGAESWNAKSFLELLAMPGARGRLAIDAQGAPIGLSLALIVLDTIELLTLAVPPNCRRCGIGTFLLLDFLECAKISQATNAFLEVAEDNLAAIDLYKRHGFVFEACRPDYYRRGGSIQIAAHVMRRPMT